MCIHARVDRASHTRHIIDQRPRRDAQQPGSPRGGVRDRRPAGSPVQFRTTPGAPMATSCLAEPLKRTPVLSTSPVEMRTCDLKKSDSLGLQICRLVGSTAMGVALLLAAVSRGRESSVPPYSRRSGVGASGLDGKVTIESGGPIAAAACCDTARMTRTEPAPTNCGRNAGSSVAWSVESQPLHLP